eukprot:TRINITY_DN7949_c0_g4_i1.p1 TRINITY_DN7949_c0_g4~~TRINITY_DN7949_c0_g4_i1.p1  ORF type:complete len:389 (+),score=85.19 TRINITY_DN7949_c0_g4_i1:66-1169(+)
MLKKKEEVRLSKSAITCQTWNEDKSQVAVSFNDNKILIFAVEGTDSAKWKLLHTLEAHDMTVLGLHWGHTKNRIVSCSEDLTAYVWQLKGDKWCEELVVMDSGGCSYAGLQVKWCSSESKFAIGTGSGRTYVCYYDDSNNWWVAKATRDHSSSVTCVDWMPCGDLLLATGSTDCRLNIISAYLKPVDGKVANPGKLGKMLGQFDIGGWVHDVSFCPDSNWLAAVSHNSSISFVNTSGSDYDKIQTIKLNTLPFSTVRFVSDEVCVAAGNDFYPVAFEKNGDKWAMAGKWLTSSGLQKKSSSTKAAMEMFQDQETFGAAQVKKTVNTHHRSAITQIAVVKYGSSYSFSTCGTDGALYIFKAADMIKVE